MRGKLAKELPVYQAFGGREYRSGVVTLNSRLVYVVVRKRKKKGGWEVLSSKNITKAMRLKMFIAPYVRCKDDAVYFASTKREAHKVIWAICIAARHAAPSL